MNPGEEIQVSGTGLGLIGGFAAWMWIQTAWAVHPGHIEGAILFTKYAVLFYVITRLLTTVESLEVFAWCHVIGCGLWGWIAYGANSGGRFEMVLGPNVDDSNLLGFHLVTGLAFGGFLFLTSPGVKRFAVLGPMPFILNAIILTASRTAIVGLVAAALAAALLVPRSRRWFLLPAGALGVVLFFMLAQNDLFWERAASIKNTDESTMDESAASRVAVARANMEMFFDNPMGLGHRGNEFVSPQYLGDEVLTQNSNAERVRSAHNSAMAILADHGVPGAILFVLLNVWVALRLYALRKLDREGLDPRLGGIRAAVGAALFSALICSLFVNVLKAEVIVWMLAMLASLDAIAHQSIRMKTSASTTVKPVAGSVSRGGRYRPQQNLQYPA